MTIFIPIGHSRTLLTHFNPVLREKIVGRLDATYPGQIVPFGVLDELRYTVWRFVCHGYMMNLFRLEPKE